MTEAVVKIYRTLLKLISFEETGNFYEYGERKPR